MSENQEPTEKRLGELITDAVADIQILIRHHIDLTVAELRESGRRILRSSVTIIAALMLLMISGLLLVISFAFLLTEFGIPTWLAFVIDAGIFLVVAVILLFIARSNAKKIQPPTLAMTNAEASINQITETLAKERS